MTIIIKMLYKLRKTYVDQEYGCECHEHVHDRDAEGYIWAQVGQCLGQNVVAVVEHWCCPRRQDIRIAKGSGASPAFTPVGKTLVVRKAYDLKAGYTDQRAAGKA